MFYKSILYAVKKIHTLKILNSHTPNPPQATTFEVIEHLKKGLQSPPPPLLEFDHPSLLGNLDYKKQHHL
jgi:hypothetical protein